MKNLTWALLSLMLFLGLGVASAQDDGFGVGGDAVAISIPTLNPAGGLVEQGATISGTFSDEFIGNVMNFVGGAAFILYVENDATAKLESTPEILMGELQKYLADEEEMTIAEGDDGEEIVPYRIAVYGMDPESDPDDPDDLAGYMKWYAPITIVKGVGGNIALRAKVAVLSEAEDGYEILYSDEFTADYYVARPAAPTFEPGSGAMAFGAAVILNCEVVGAAIYYTTDGTEPTMESAEFEPNWDEIQIFKDVTIKAIAVLDGISSTVVEATYTVVPVENAKLMLSPMKGDTVGMNVNTGISFTDGTPESEGWAQTFPATVYYTTDGTTEPSKAAYEAQTDKENGAIKMVAVKWEERWGWYGPVEDADGNLMALTFTEPTHLKAIGYLMDGDEVLLTTALFDSMLQIESEAKPTFSIASCAKLEVSDKLIIENPHYYAPFDKEMPEWPEDYWENEEAAAAYEEAMVAYKEAEKAYKESIADIPQTELYFSFDGTKPTVLNRYADDNESVFSTEAGRNLEITFGQNEAGYYAYVPEILGYFSDADTIRLGAEGWFSVQVLSVTTEVEGGDGPVPLSAKYGKPTAKPFVYGSDFVTAYYTLNEDIVVAAPTFDPAGGEVSFGTKVKISCATEGAKIYYYCYIGENEPKAAEYKSPIAINQAMTINSLATCGAFTSEVAKAEYKIIAKPTFSVPVGSVKEGTEVEISCATEDAKIYYTVDDSEPTAESTEYTEAIKITGKVTIKAIAIKGNVKSEVASATYTVPTANEGEELAGVSVYPNPSNGLFNIELPVAATIEVFMSNGMLYRRVNAQAGVTTLNIDRSGIYFLRITGEGRTAVKRVIVR